MAATLDKKKLKLWYQLWHDHSAYEGAPAYSCPDDLIGVLQVMRDEPEALAACFAPISRGDQLLERVQQLFALDARRSGAPYVLAEPAKATDEQLTAWALDALARAKEPTLPVTILRRDITPHEVGHTAPLSEKLNDDYVFHMGQIERRERTGIHFLSEAYYHLCASVEVQNWLLTPLYWPTIQELDPYAPHLDLWAHGAIAVQTWGEAGEGVRVYVST